MQGAQLGVRLASTASFGTDEKSLRSVARSTYAMSASYAAATFPMDFMETAEAQF
jgi:hypothetical protein